MPSLCCLVSSSFSLFVCVCYFYVYNNCSLTVQTTSSRGWEKEGKKKSSPVAVVGRRWVNSWVTRRRRCDWTRNDPFREPLGNQYFAQRARARYSAQLSWYSTVSYWLYSTGQTAMFLLTGLQLQQERYIKTSCHVVHFFLLLCFAFFQLLSWISLCCVVWALNDWLFHVLKSTISAVVSCVVRSFWKLKCLNLNERCNHLDCSL